MNYSKNPKNNPQLTVYYWLLYHFMLPKYCKENGEYAKDGYVEIDCPFKLVNKDFKYYKFNSKDFKAHNIKVPIDLIANCMIGNYPKGYKMLDELIKPYHSLKDKRMRILKGYSENERKELEEAKDNGFLSVIDLFYSIKHDDNNCHALYEKYYHEDANEDNQLARDIADYYAGVAKFPEEKWYVHLIKDDSFSYFNLGLNGEKTYIGDNSQTGNFQTQFTKQEVEDINPNYIPFLEKVPVEELED